MSTMDKIKAKVDNMLHKDTTSSDPTGPHNTHAANKADPRVDSDQYGTAGNTSGAGGVGGGQYTSGHNTTGHSTTGHTTGTGLTGTHGTHGTTGHTTGSGLTGTHGTHGHSDPTGPHDSRLANKADPRVDSDRIGTQGNTAGAGGYGTGQYGETTGSGLTGHSTTGHGHHTGHGTTGGGLAGALGSTGYGDATGPHHTHTANVLDPRVDSDRYGTAGNTSGAGGIGGGQYTEGTTGHHAQHGHHGQHGTTGGVGGIGGNNAGTGNAPKTAGPHSSDLMNKMDPRVDSDLDGSKTVGGNATYQ